MRAAISIIFEFLEASRSGLKKVPWEFLALDNPKPSKNQHEVGGYCKKVLDHVYFSSKEDGTQSDGSSRRVHRFR